MGWEQKEISVTDKKLLVLYKDAHTDSFKSFEEIVLTKHPFLIERFDLFNEHNNYAVFVFDLKNHAEDWDHVLKGQYSQMSPEAKSKIKAYFTEGSEHWNLVDSFLNPERFYEDYSRLLADPLDRPDMLILLKEVGELCDKPCIPKEILSASTEKSDYIDSLKE